MEKNMKKNIYIYTYIHTYTHTYIYTQRMHLSLPSGPLPQYMTLHLLINPHMIFMYLKLFLSKQILKKKKKNASISQRINVQIQFLRIKFHHF